MRVEPFLEHLRDAMPGREALEAYGLDDDEIADIQSTFIATTRQVPREKSVSSGEIERMIREFDCSKVEIGLIRFQEQLKPHPHGMVFAFCEADPLVLREDSAIALFDCANPDASQIECAADSERFLDGLAAFIDVRKNKVAETIDVREIPQRRGGVRYSVDQQMNPHTVGLKAGGTFGENVVISGQLGLGTGDPRSDELAKLLLREMKKRFTKIKSYYVGAEALSLLDLGARLTINFAAPPEYVLAR